MKTYIFAILNHFAENIPEKAVSAFRHFYIEQPAEKLRKGKLEDVLDFFKNLRNAVMIDPVVRQNFGMVMIGDELCALNGEYCGSLDDGRTEIKVLGYDKSDAWR